MRHAIGTLVLAIVALIIPISVMAEEFSSCWVESVLNPLTLEERTVTRCRISGGSVVDYASDSSVPATLSPDAGIDLNGDCWFLTSRSTSFIFLSRSSNGEASLGWAPDPANPGAVAYTVGLIPRCTSEPNLATDPAAEAWSYIMSYIHPPPAPDLSPPAGDGITGLETFVSLVVPDPHNASLSGVGVSLEVRIEVEGVKVNWGDGGSDTYPATAEALSGYPDGIARHIYEVKDQTGYDLTVAYDWTARWRVSGGSWQFLDVPDTTTTVNYPVSEIVSVITG